MIKMSSKLIVNTCMLFLLSISAHTTIALKNSKGTMSVGGKFTFPIEWDPVRQTSISLDLAPEFGVFLLDGFELVLHAYLNTPLFNYKLRYGLPSSVWRWGIGSKINYQFKVDWPVIPYVGFGLGHEMAKFDITTIALVADIPAGILVPLNEHVALVVGLSSQIALIGQLKIFDKLRFEPGYLGVKAHF